MVYILSVGLLPEGEWLGYTLYYLLLLVLLRVSQIDPAFILRRSLIALPFILIALTALVTTPGVKLFELPITRWEITESGLIRFLSLFLRTWLAIQAAILLTATTRAPDLFWGLATLRMPSLLIAVISFMYRYLFVLSNEALRMIRARSARSPRITHQPRPSIFWIGRVTGSMVGTLFLRSLERSERVYSAMLSRGFDGQMMIMRRFTMKHIDWIVLIVFSAILLSSLILIQLG